MNQTTPLKILLVEDHHIIIDGMLSLFAGNPSVQITGYAKSAREAFDKLREENYDVVLMDIHLPGITGIEATAEIRREFKNVQVLALTMSNNHEDIKAMLAAGAIGYVVKSATKDELELAIKKAAAGQNYLSTDTAFGLMHAGNLNRLRNSLPPGMELTNRELEVLQLVCDGLSSVAIGEKLNISPKTVDSHRTNLIHKLKVKNIAELIKWAIKHGLV